MKQTGIGAWIAGAAVLLSALGGCGGAGGGFGLGFFLGGSGSVSVVSTAQPTRLDASFRTAVYSYEDGNTADLYFSDLTMEEIEAIASGTPRSEVAPEGAQILHLHLFLTPRAGRTPIEFSASNVTLTHLVIAGEVLGVYGGGGFLLPSRTFAVEPGGGKFGGTMRDATVRFIDGTEGFDDRIGSGVMDGTLSARLDPEAARSIAAVLDALTRAATR